MTTQIFFLSPPSHSHYSGARPSSPIPPILPKPSSNSPMLEKRRVKKAKQRSKKDFSRFSNSMPTSRNTLTPTIIALMKTSEVESRTQGSRTRPRTQKKSEAKAKDSLSEDRHSRGQEQECSRPRPRTKDTSASALQKKKKLQTKKKGLHKNFSGDLHKKTYSKRFFKRFTKF